MNAKRMRTWSWCLLTTGLLILVTGAIFHGIRVITIDLAFLILVVAASLFLMAEQGKPKRAPRRFSEWGKPEWIWLGACGGFVVLAWLLVVLR